MTHNVHTDGVFVVVSTREYIVGTSVPNRLQKEERGESLAVNGGTH